MKKLKVDWAPQYREGIKQSGKKEKILKFLI